MTTINMLLHELLHGAAMYEVTFDRPRWRHGTVVECPCGKRWIARAPWFRKAGF